MGGDTLAVMRVMGTFSSMLAGVLGGAWTVAVGMVVMVVAVVAGLVLGDVATTVGDVPICTTLPAVD